jgi:hypothetical protein
LTTIIFSMGWWHYYFLINKKWSAYKIWFCHYLRIIENLLKIIKKKFLTFQISSIVTVAQKLP